MNNRTLSIGLIVAGYHPGNPADYLHRAFTSLGHTPGIVTPESFQPETNYDLHLLIDSGVAFSSELLTILTERERVAFWCIDFRHNKSRKERVPNDWEVVTLLSNKGHTIFQAQFEDQEECLAKGIERCHWLPLGADSEIWSDTPPEEKRFDLGFVGNVFDEARAEVLQLLLNSDKFRFAFGGPTQKSKGAWKEDGAKVLRTSNIGFNINSFFGSPVSFDINMRFFETLSTGTPLITNNVPSIRRLFKEMPPFIKTYERADEIEELVIQALGDEEFLSSGDKGRGYIEENATYRHRAEEILKILELDS